MKYPKQSLTRHRLGLEGGSFGWRDAHSIAPGTAYLTLSCLAYGSSQSTVQKGISPVINAQLALDSATVSVQEIPCLFQLEFKS